MKVKSIMLIVMLYFFGTGRLKVRPIIAGNTDLHVEGGFKENKRFPGQLVSPL